MLYKKLIKILQKVSQRYAGSKSVLFILLMAIFTAYAGMAHAQESRFGYAHYTNGKGDTLNYRILYPDYDTMRKYPLVIFLHGSGERGNDNKAQLKWGVLNFATDQMLMQHPAIIVAPQCPEKMQWANFSGFRTNGLLRLLPEPSMPMQLVIGLIHQLIKQAPVDTDRIYITGLSMGGFGTYDAIERYPHLFAAAVPVAGGGDPTKASLIAHIPLWDFHGAEDAAVNPEYSRIMIRALWKTGAHPGYTEYPGVGHFSWLGAYSDPVVLAWLFRQHK
jgi:predicted peptidase